LQSVANMGESLCREHYLRVGAHVRAVLRPSRVEDAVTVDAAVGVRAEVVAQALHQAGGASLSAIARRTTRGRMKTRDCDAELRRHADHVPSRLLRLRDRVAKVVDEHGRESADRSRKPCECGPESSRG
jgi:protein involved in polysaccharide export with SLBB domain